MIKRFIVAVLLLLSAASYANAAGTINLSLSQQFDAQGLPLANCRLYLYQAGTVATPQNAYSDVDLTAVLPNPLSCDASGRIQQFFLADGQIKIRLTDENGTTILSADNILVVGPSSGGGGGGSVDPTAIYQTGDLKVRYGTGTHSGWVRANGRTIGSATSGATERANSDTQSLWEYLCTNDTALQATISGGYSGSCANDYAANKTIQLPDWRGRAVAGLDDMGNSAAGNLTSTYFGTSAIVLGAAGGSEKATLAQANLPNVTLTVTGTVTPTVGGQSAIAVGSAAGSQSVSSPGGTSVYTTAAFSALSTAFSNGVTSSINGNVAQTLVKTATPSRLATIYVKL